MQSMQQQTKPEGKDETEPTSKKDDNVVDAEFTEKESK